MTHDELLTKVDSVFYEEEGGTQIDFKASNNQYRALRAVVELHHEHISGSGDIYCYNCQQKYPCFTIQAIEKELSNGQTKGSSN